MFGRTQAGSFFILARAPPNANGHQSASALNAPAGARSFLAVRYGCRRQTNHLGRILMSAKKARKGSVKIVASFRHYRTGELIVAANYGHRGFPIRSWKRKPR